MADLEIEKEAAARKSLEWVRDGMALGLGTGSTAAYVIRLLGRRVREEGLRIRAVPTSASTEALARAEGIPLVTFADVKALDVAIDGADEVDPSLRLIKGGGGALLREKIVAAAARQVLIIADSSKPRESLGRFPLPVEVVRFGWELVAERLSRLGVTPRLRQGREGTPFVTDEGHYLLDCPFGTIADPGALARTLDAMPGVVEHGLFLDMADVVLVGRGDSVEVRERGLEPGR
jgi:ribose 5-phosphate isomerase A